MDPCKNYKLYREHISSILNSNNPCIPFMGVYLSDLLFIEEGNPDNKDEKINFEKRIMYTKIIKQIQFFQQLSYSSNLKEDKIIQKCLENLHSLDNETAYQLSLICEPK